MNTMITTEGKTEAEILSEVIQAGIDQGGQCLDSTNSCVNSDHQGKHCFVGWLLDFEDPELMSWGGDVVELNHRRPDALHELLKVTNLKTLKNLQEMHDTSEVCTLEDLADRLQSHVKNPAVIAEWVQLRTEQIGGV